MKYSKTILIAFLISIGIHLLILFVGNYSSIQNPEFGVQGGEGSTQVELVASAPSREKNTPVKKFEPIRSKPLPTQAPKPEDVVEPKAKKEKTNPETTPPTQTEKNKTNEKKEDSGTTGPGGSSSQGTPKGSSIASPDYLRNPPPEYPEEARENRQEGLVVLRVLVDPNGKPLNVTLQKSSGFELLDESAVRAVKRWKFKPAMKDGVPFESQAEVPIRFRLN